MRSQIIAILSIFFLLNMVGTHQISAASDNSPLTYWYIGYDFDINKEDKWIPFQSYTDVPYSLPLRGFISDSRNYFLDLGALEWLSDWVEYRYSWPIHEHTRGMSEDNLTGQLQYLFETTTNRLQKPISTVDELRHYIPIDYVSTFEPPYEVFVPLIVMFGLDDTYNEISMKEWVIHPEIVETTLNEAFPLINWEIELLWFNYNNATDFADLMAEKTYEGLILIDDDYINRTDVILHNIISNDPRYSSHDMVLPTLIMVQKHSLYATWYNMAVGGLGRLPSSFPEVGSWCLNGRGVVSYFFAGDPDKPRASITPTVIHELGHCIGQTDIHSLFGWFAAASSMSVMCAYQQPTSFDRFDMDLINNCQGIQLWGRYLDEIDYFREFVLTTNQQTELDELEESLASVPDLLIASNLEQLQLILYETDAALETLSNELGTSRKSSNWSEFAPSIDVHVDWIVGPGIPDAEMITESLEPDFIASSEFTQLATSTLPTPVYNLTIEVHSTSETFNEYIFQFWGRNLVESNTSTFDPDVLPNDAWTSWPRNKIFQIQSGYEIDGYTVEQWLVDHPLTEEETSKIHYRFYIMNLENISKIDDGLEPILVPVAIGVTSGIAIIGVLVIIRKRRKT